MLFFLTDTAGIVTNTKLVSLLIAVSYTVLVRIGKWLTSWLDIREAHMIYAVTSKSKWAGLDGAIQPAHDILHRHLPDHCISLTAAPSLLPHRVHCGLSEHSPRPLYPPSPCPPSRRGRGQHELGLAQVRPRSLVGLDAHLLVYLR